MYRDLLRVAVCVAIVLVTSMITDGNSARAEDLNARQILDRLTKVYAESESYSDIGVVTAMVVTNDGRELTTQKTILDGIFASQNGFVSNSETIEADT